MSRTRSGRSTGGSEAPGSLLNLPDLASIAAMAVLLYFLPPFTWPSGAVHAGICLAAAAGVAGAGTVADRIWDATMAPSLAIPFPAPATLARYPFRLIGGGIAVTAVMLLAERTDLLWVRDVPVKDIFAAGTMLAAGHHLVRDTRLRRWNAAGPGPGDHDERNDR